ncbi:carcinine transporter [Manduca sexta]|uniref:carcinine transporter n=1 Tax=Manduca sexta TaxID=7130 RepID=UPI001890725C|nr:carcinine transporter [Manduca sexta]
MDVAKERPKAEARETQTDKDVVDYDELLSSAGEFGRYQFLLFIATFPFYVFGVFVYFSQLFMTETSSNHWCWVPELANMTDIERRSFAIPKTNDSLFGYSQCSMYEANWTELLETGQRPDESWRTIPCQHGWEFNKTEIPYPTISSELGWVCDKDSYQASAQSVFFLGSIVGGFLIGWIADRFGRLPAIVISNLIGCLGGLISIFARNFAEFTACRFFMGISYDNCMMMAYLLVLEYVAPRYKTLLANLSFALFYSVPVTLLPWLALLCGHWWTIGLVTSVPLALGLFSPLFIPESPRWLLSRGRVDDAIKKIETISRVNKKEIPPKLIEQFKISIANQKSPESQSYMEILKRPSIRKMFILICLLFMCCTIVFDGLVRSIGQLDFDFFISFSVVSFTEFPSLLVVAFIMDWMGRRWMAITCMTLSCIFTFLTVGVGAGFPSVICAVIARFFVNMSYNATMQWAAEILPTPVRGSGTAFVHVCGFIGNVISPYIVYLKIFRYWLPLAVVALIAGLGGVISFALPETAKKEMPHTFEDSEALARSHKLWDLPWNRKKESVEGHVNNSFEM